MLVTDPIAALADLPDRPLPELDLVIAELGRPELRPTPAHQLARAYALSLRSLHDNDPATLAAAVAEYSSCAYRGVARGLVGRQVAARQMVTALTGLPFDAAGVRAMIEDAGDDPTEPGTRDVLLTMCDVMAAFVDDAGFDRESALRRLDAATAAVSPDSELRSILPLMKASLGVKYGAEHGRYHDATAAAEYARQMLRRGDISPQQRATAEAMLISAEAMAAGQRGDTATSAEAMLSMLDKVDRMPQNSSTAAMRRLIAQAAGVAGAGTAGEMAGDMGDADEAGISAGERAWRLMIGAAAVLQPALDRKDSAGLARGIGKLREAIAVAPPDYPHRALLYSQLGQMLFAQVVLGAGEPVLADALRWLARAQQTAAHPGHPVWAPATMALGLAQRVAGRTAQSRASGQRALRGHAWSVLLQAGTADAADAARDAADDARQVARWCLADGDPAGAAAALDAGRCLMLYAATVTMDIPARLRGLGRTDLLDRWRRDAKDPDLRADVLTALTGAPLSDLAVPDVLDPPAPDEIARALDAHRADVLVYLLAKDDQGSGYAVLLPAGRRPSSLPLPRLSAEGPVAQHRERLGVRGRSSPPAAFPAGGSKIGPARDAGAVDEAPGGGSWAADLDRLCDWAWTSAIGPLLDILDHWRIGRAPRIVLIPTGDLALVPWHAARDTDGTRAVEVATFSYAASARLLCQNAERGGTTHDGPALIVSDPTGDLPDARAEALAIRDAFHPGATVLDRETATPDAVRDWLLAGGGSLLHLACHGAVRPGLDGSHLRLAGGARLSARDILQARRATAVEVVALAACTTSVPSGAYDEAFSLATAFLATGARSVFASLWEVPSDTTSLLMFMAHHYLRSAGKRPVDALNHAQRWMLNPDRAIPATMPPALAAQARRLTGDDVTAWAGFAHHGL